MDSVEVLMNRLEIARSGVKLESEKRNRLEGKKASLEESKKRIEERCSEKFGCSVSELKDLSDKARQQAEESMAKIEKELAPKVV